MLIYKSSPPPLHLGRKNKIFAAYTLSQKKKKAPFGFQDYCIDDWKMQIAMRNFIPY